jgi:hypothetical protein
MSPMHLGSKLGQYAAERSLVAGMAVAARDELKEPS